MMRPLSQTPHSHSPGSHSLDHTTHATDPTGRFQPEPFVDVSPLPTFSEDTVAYAAYREWADHELRTNPRISIVVPAYNESERIVPTIGAIAAYMSSRNEPWELLIADDGSTDSTVADVSALGLVNLHVLEAERNGGKGSAVRRGMMAARGDLVLFADADQSTPIESIEALIAQIDRGHDVAIGSRAADGSLEQAKSLTRRFFSGGLRFIVRTVFRLGVKDSQCGFKLFTARAADDLFRRQRIDGFSFDLEVLYLAEKFGYSTVEVPVEWYDAPGSTVDAARVAAKFLLDLVAIRADDIRGAYDTKRPRPGEAVRPGAVPKEATR